MKFTIAKDDLESALNTTAFAQGKDGWTKHYFFRTTETGVEVLTTNHRYCSSIPITTGKVADKEEDNEETFTVEGNRIRTWLKHINTTNALVLDTDGKVVKAKSVRGNVRWSCSDADFPYWDAQLAKAETQTTIKVDNLYNILNHHKHFVGKPDTKTLLYRYITVQDGGVLSGNGFSMSLTLSDDLSGTKFYLTQLDLSPLLGFLKTLDGDVEILATERMVFFKGSNESVFGYTVPSKRAVSGLGNLDVKNMSGSLTATVANFTATTEDISSSIGLLSSAMDETDEVIKFSFEEGSLAICGQSLAGDVDKIDVALSEFEDEDEVLEKPLYFNRQVFNKVLSLLDLNDLEMQILKNLNHSPVVKHKVSGYDTFSLIVPLQTANF